MKKMIALLLAMVMVCALFACGGNTETSGSTSGSTSSSTTESTSSSTTESTAPELTYREKVMNLMAELSTATAPGLNTYEASWEDMVAYLTEQGVIAADAEQVDMLTTTGYVKMYDGSFNDTYAFADKAVDFGGIYLCWWNLAEPTAAYDCYTGIEVNGNNIIIMGGMYVFKTTVNCFGSFAIGFAEDVSEDAQAAALAVMEGIDGTAYSLTYMGSTTDLAMALMEAGLLEATDIAGAVDMNQTYIYPCQRQDWVGYEESETGYGEIYETTNYAQIASSGYNFGKVTILYFAAADVSASSWYPHLASIFNQAKEQGTVTPYCRLTTGWDYTPFLADADGNYIAEGTQLEIAVDGVYGQFVLIINE